MAGDRNGVGREAATRLDEADALTNAVADAGWARCVAGDDHFFLATAAAVVVVVMVVEGVKDAVGGALEAAAEAVVVAFVVVVTHVVAGGFVSGVDLFSGDFDVLPGSLATVFDLVGGVDAAAVFAFGDVDLGLVGSVAGVAAVDLDVDSVVFCGTGVTGDYQMNYGERKEGQTLTVRV